MMNEAIDNLLRLFYADRIPELKNVQVLNWSPETGHISLRWKEGERVVTVKSFDYGAQKVITELT